MCLAHGSRDISKLKSNLTQSCQLAGNRAQKQGGGKANNPYLTGNLLTYEHSLAHVAKPWAKSSFVHRGSTCQSFNTHIGPNKGCSMRRGESR